MFTYILATVLATVLVLSPVLVLRAWNEGARVVRRRSARRMAVGIGAALCLAGCAGPSPLDLGPPHVFTETCKQSDPPNGSGWFASHDFHTTDPATLARVVVFADHPAIPIAGLDAGPVYGSDERPMFYGSVAIVSCSGGDTSAPRYFILEP